MSDTPNFDRDHQEGPQSPKSGLLRRLRRATSRSDAKTALAQTDARLNQSADSRDMLQYWNSVRQGHATPRRSDIDPRGIAGLLSRTFILEQIAPGLGRFRVAGTHLADILGMDVRGMPISALLKPAARDPFSQSLAQLFATPGILRAVLVAPAELRRPELHAELLILPLRDDAGLVNRAMGCLTCRGDIGRVPRRFDIRHIRVDPVSVVKPFDVAKQPSAPETPILHNVPQPTEDHPNLRLAPLKPGQPDYLRLVISE